MSFDANTFVHLFQFFEKLKKEGWKRKKEKEILYEATRKKNSNWDLKE